MGASLSNILFSFVLEKYIVCDVCGLRSSSFESSNVLYISPTVTSSMQNFILQGLQQKLQKSCSRCNKNTRHVESSYILQSPKYLLLFVNRIRYINNNVKTVRLGPLKFSRWATIDHHGPSTHSGHCTASINCCKKHSIATITQLRGLELLITKTSPLHMFYYLNWLTYELGLEKEGGSLVAPMALAYPLHPIDNRSRNRRQNLWVGWCVSSWWPLFPSRSSVFIYICILYTSSVIRRIYTYSRSVIQYWWSCTPSHSIGPILSWTVFWGSARFLSWMPLFVFFGLPIVSCSLINSLRLGCLWLLVFVLNNTLILGIWCSAISHLPGCFCPWIFFKNIGFNMVPSDPFMSHLQCSYSTRIFCRGVSGSATDCPCGVWCRVLTTCLLHVGPPFGNRLLNNSWAVGLTLWIVYLHLFCIFGICNYICLDTSYHFSASSSYILLFIFSSTSVLTFSINVVFILSIEPSYITDTLAAFLRFLPSAAKVRS